MPNAISALNGQIAAGEVTVREAGLRGMITLRGDLSDPKLKSVCRSITGLDIPKYGQAVADGDKGICWMSPDELLVLVPYDDVPQAISAFDIALKDKHYLAVNVSDARALLTVEGDYAREVIAKLAPVDLHRDTFKKRDFRRTHLGQIAAAFWMREEDIIDVICFRSVAGYAFDLLATSAKAGKVGVL